MYLLLLSSKPELVQGQVTTERMGGAMYWNEEFRKRFGGKWNTIFLIVVLVVCFRFVGAEWKAREFELRLLYSLYLVLIVIATGGVFALLKVLFTKFNTRHYYSTSSKIPADIVWGLKYGIGSGALIVFVFGLLLVDNYLGPLKEVFDLVIKKIVEKIP